MYFVSKKRFEEAVKLAAESRAREIVSESRASRHVTLREIVLDVMSDGKPRTIKRCFVLVKEAHPTARLASVSNELSYLTRAGAISRIGRGLYVGTRAKEAA